MLIMRIKRRWIIAILAAFISILSYGYIYRPLVDYTLSADPVIDLQHSSYFPVDVKICNRGSTDAPLILHITVENATILKSPWKGYITYDESEVWIYWTVNKDTENYESETLNIVPNDKVNSFNIKYEVIKRNDLNVYGLLSFSGITSYFFAEIKGHYPEFLYYNRTGPTQFTRTN